MYGEMRQSSVLIYQHLKWIQYMYGDMRQSSVQVSAKDIQSCYLTTCLCTNSTMDRALLPSKLLLFIDIQQLNMTKNYLLPNRHVK